MRANVRAGSAIGAAKNCVVAARPDPATTTQACNGFLPDFTRASEMTADNESLNSKFYES
jgi:hypothetical protein